MAGPSSIVQALRRQPVWIILAVSSGGCAALNGVFAKLTTTALTSDLSTALASLLGLDSHNRIIDLGVRGFFFGMNLLFNAAMWALFTAALTKGDSTTRVSIVNVSANFVLTALLGWILFAESLPLLWWLGAAFLAVGNVVIGRSREGDSTTNSDGDHHHRGEEQQQQEEEEAGQILLADESEEEEAAADEGQQQQQQQQPQQQGDLIELDETAATRLRRGEDVDAPL